jgi:hypothetical protein
MFKLRLLIASCVLVLACGAANASTVVFDVNASAGAATFSGTMTIDVTTGTLISASISSAQFTSIFDLKGGHGPFPLPPNPPSGWFEDLSNHTGTPPGIIELDFTTTNPGSLVDFTGGVIFSGSAQGDGFFSAAMSGTISAETPIPAALPLFASGLGAMGLLGWRRKRKGAAIAA